MFRGFFDEIASSLKLLAMTVSYLYKYRKLRYETLDTGYICPVCIFIQYQETSIQCRCDYFEHMEIPAI
jgi:hypothetical protein